MLLLRLLCGLVAVPGLEPLLLLLLRMLCSLAAVHGLDELHQAVHDHLPRRRHVELVLREGQAQVAPKDHSPAADCAVHGHLVRHPRATSWLMRERPPGGLRGT